MHARFLAYFNAIVEHGSIRKAAEAINVAPSAINRHLLELEDMMGEKLFERLPRGVRLTAAGEILSLHVRSTLRDYKRALSEIEQLRTGERGAVTIACIESALLDLLPDALGAFEKRFPRVEFTVLGMPAQDAVKAVYDNTADLCLIFNPPPRLSMTQMASADFPLGIVAPPDHPLARKRTCLLSDLVGERIVMPDESITIFDQVDQVLVRSAVRLSPRIRSNSMAFLHSFVLQGDAVSIMTPVGITRHLRDRRLAFIPLQDRGLTPQRLIAGVADPSMPVPVANFCQHLRHFLPGWHLTIMED